MGRAFRWKRGFSGTYKDRLVFTDTVYRIHPIDNVNELRHVRTSNAWSGTTKSLGSRLIVNCLQWQAVVDPLRTMACSNPVPAQSSFGGAVRGPEDHFGGSEHLVSKACSGLLHSLISTIVKSETGSIFGGEE